MNESLKHALKVVQVVLGLFALFLFVTGVTDISDHVMAAKGWDEVCIVVGAFMLAMMLMPLYGTLHRVLPPIPSAAFLVYGLHTVLFLVYTGQCIAFDFYLAEYVGLLSLLFVIGDVAVAALYAVARKSALKLTSLLYVTIMCAKMMFMWNYLNDEHFNARATTLGPNGLKATLLLVIAVIQLPVLTTRVECGVDLFDAYTQNMAAVFTHTLHVLDTIAMFFAGSDYSHSDAVQWMLLIFSLMGMIGANMYHALLFYDSDQEAAHGALRVRRAGDVAALSGKEGTRDERLLHYILWLLFFIDLPFGVQRTVFFVTDNKEISVFAAKNTMMVIASIMLSSKHASVNE